MPHLVQADSEKAENQLLRQAYVTILNQFNRISNRAVLRTENKEYTVTIKPDLIHDEDKYSINM